MEKKKKILLVNKFYYPRGGDCVYTLEMEKLLRKNGHEVAVFAMDHPDTLPTMYRQYFPEEVQFSSQNISSIFETVLRPFGTREVKKKFNRLLDDFHPDIVHLGNIHSQLSPVVAEIAYRRRIKVIWTLHDYKLLCPRYDCLRNGRIVCEECLTNKFSVYRYTCMKNSRAASFLAYLEAVKWDKEKIEKYVTRFICPSEFMKTMMQRGGFPGEKLTTMHHFLNSERIVEDETGSPANYYCFIGRISTEKGVETLLKAASQLPYNLKVIGSGPLLDQLSLKYQSGQIEFLGYKNWDEIKPILKSARFLVSPSECFEVLGLSNIEALCLGVPILGANIGAIPELINEQNGILFDTGNDIDLKDKIDFFFNEGKNRFDRKRISKISKELFSAENYYNRLLSIYNE